MNEPQLDSSIINKTIRAMAAQAVGQYGAMAVGVIKGMILARLVDNEVYGVVFLAVTYVSFMNIFRMQVREAVTRDADASQTRLMTLYVIEVVTVVPALLIALVGYLLLPGLGSEGLWLAIGVILASRVVTALGSVPMYLLERDLRHRVLASLTLAGTVLALAVAVPLAWFGYPLAAILVDVTIPAAVLAVGAVWTAGWHPSRDWDADIARDSMRFSTTMWMGGLFGKITFEYDDWLVGTFRGEGALGYYGKAYQSAKLPMDVVAGVIASVSYGLYGQSRKQSMAALSEAYSQLTWLLVRVIALSSIVMLAAADEFILIYYGPDWAPVVPLLRLMFVYVMARPIWQNDAILLVSIGKESLHRWMMGLQAVVLLLIGTPAVLMYGARGASVAVSIMMLIGALGTGIAVYRSLTIRPLFIYGLPFLLMAVMTPLVYWGGLYLPLPALPMFIIKGGVTTVGFIGLIWLVERETFRDAVALVRAQFGGAGDDTGSNEGESK